MASPQLGNGYTEVAHEIIEQVARHSFTGSQFAIIMIIWRFTYGFHRKDHEFSVSFLEIKTKLNEKTVRRELAELIDLKVIVVTKEATHTESRRLSFNKNYDAWKVKKRGEPMDKSLLGVGVNRPPGEGVNTPPHSDHSEGVNRPPMKYIKDLNISFKYNVEDYFKQFYEVYPRKISKAAAEKAFTKLSKLADFDANKIILNTMNFAETCKLLDTEIRYIPHPSTYLNQKRYEDYETVDPEGLAAGKQTKFDSNLEFLKSQLGGDAIEPGSSSLTTGESLSSLSEPSAGPAEE